MEFSFPMKRILKMEGIMEAIIERGGMSIEEMIQRFDAIPFEQFIEDLRKEKLRLQKVKEEYILHLINKKDKHLHILYSDEIKLNKLIKEGKSERYFSALDWYLSHGYVKMEDAISSIEGQIQNKKKI